MRPQYDAFKILKFLYLNRNSGKMSSKEIAERTKIPRKQITPKTNKMLAIGYIQKEKIKGITYFWISDWQLGPKGVKRILEKGMEEIDESKLE